MYLAAIMDLFYKLLVWRVSNKLEADFYVETLNEALQKFGPPEIINTEAASSPPSPRPTG